MSFKRKVLRNQIRKETGNKGLGSLWRKIAAEAKQKQKQKDMKNDNNKH